MSFRERNAFLATIIPIFPLKEDLKIAVKRVNKLGELNKINLDKKSLFKLMEKNRINLQVHYIPVYSQNYYLKKYGFNEIDFKNKTAVITGGAQGFGLDIAKKFLSSGAKVFIWDIDENELIKATKEINNSNLEYNLVDVSNLSETDPPVVDKEVSDAVVKSALKQDEIIEEVSVLFKNTKNYRETITNPKDKSDTSKVYAFFFAFSSGDKGRIDCTDYSKKMGKKHGWIDNLRIGLVSSDASAKHGLIKIKLIIKIGNAFINQVFIGRHFPQIQKFNDYHFKC